MNDESKSYASMVVFVIVCALFVAVFVVPWLLERDRPTASVTTTTILWDAIE